MILNSLDILILKKFHDLKKDEPDTWKWSTEFFPNETSSRERNKNYLKIVRHIKRMEELFIISNSKGKSITLDGDKVIFQKKKLPNGIRNCLLVKIDGLWNVMELY